MQGELKCLRIENRPVLDRTASLKPHRSLKPLLPLKSHRSLKSHPFWKRRLALGVQGDAESFRYAAASRPPYYSLECVEEEFCEVRKFIQPSKRVLRTIRGEIYAVLVPPGEPRPPRPFEGGGHRRVGHVGVCPQGLLVLVPRSSLEERSCTGGQQVVDVPPSPHLRHDADVEEGQEARRLRRHHQTHEFPLGPAVGEPPP